MEKIVVKEFVGENAITITDGQKLFDLIYPLLKSENKVEIDFGGVKVFASPFFNGAIGQLLKDLEPSKLNELLILKNIEDFGIDLIRRVVKNAKQYYTDPAVREAVNNTFSKNTDES